MNKIEYITFSVSTSTGKRTYIGKTTNYMFYLETWTMILKYAGIGKEFYTNCYYCCKTSHVNKLHSCNNHRCDYICDSCLVNSIRSIYYNMRDNASCRLIRTTIIKKIVNTSPLLKSDIGVLTVPKNLINPYKFFRKYTIFKFTTSIRNYKIYMFL